MKKNKTPVLSNPPVFEKNERLYDFKLENRKSTML